MGKLDRLGGTQRGESNGLLFQVGQGRVDMDGVVVASQETDLRTDELTTRHSSAAAITPLSRTCFQTFYEGRDKRIIPWLGGTISALGWHDVRRMRRCEGPSIQTTLAKAWRNDATLRHAEGREKVRNSDAKLGRVRRRVERALESSSMACSSSYREDNLIWRRQTLFVRSHNHGDGKGGQGLRLTKDTPKADQRENVWQSNVVK